MQKQTLYEITSDMNAIFNLVQSLEDDEGNPREPTEEEKQILSEWFGKSESDFERKFDSYNKFISNLKYDASVCETERKSMKDEMDRLSRRAKTAGNKVEVMKNNLRFCLERLGLQKFKTAEFSATIQNVGGKTFYALQGSKLDGIPEKFLKPRELDVQKIKDAVKGGELEIRETDENPLNRTKVFYAGKDEELPEIRWSQPTAIVLR